MATWGDQNRFHQPLTLSAKSRHLAQYSAKALRPFSLREQVVWGDLPLKPLLILI